MTPLLQPALRALAAGEVIACPTEAVWGLSCDPDNPEAVEHLLTLKRRPVRKGLILVAADLQAFAPILSGLSPHQYETLANSWPGPVTWLVPHHGQVPDWISGGQPTVALRVTAHPVMRALCRAWGGALVSTSANPGGLAPAKTALAVRRYFPRQLGAVVPGALGGLAKPTEIRELDSGAIRRAGS